MSYLSLQHALWGLLLAVAALASLAAWPRLLCFSLGWLCALSWSAWLLHERLLP